MHACIMSSMPACLLFFAALGFDSGSAPFTSARAHPCHVCIGTGRAPLQLSESKACKAVAKAVMGHYSSDGANMVTRPHPALLPSPLRSSFARLPRHHCGPYHSLTHSLALTHRPRENALDAQLV